MNAAEPAAPSASASRARAIQLRVLVIAALGLALAAWLLGHIGFHAVLSAAGSVGWRGFALLCTLAFPVFGVLGLAWYSLMPRAAHVPLKALVCARAIRDCASEALPFSQVGGMMLGVRAASVLGVPTRLAVGSMIVDITTELLAQLAYVALGLLILNAHANTPLGHALVRTFLIGLVLAAMGGGLFMLIQRRGLRWASGKLALRMFPASAAYTAAIAAALAQIYRTPLRLLLSVSLHFCGWIAGAMTTWVGFRLIGVHISVIAVIAIDGLVYAARSVTFFVPNALGVQEAAYAVLAPLFGVGKEFALAISLLKRARDIAIGIPILLLWQLYEGRRALAQRVQRSSEDDRLDQEG